MFIGIYLVAAPGLGYLGDRLRRYPLIAGAASLWSLATALSGLAGSYVQLLWARAAVGIGEAGYGAIGPSVIADLYPPRSRGRMLSFFFVALPTGSALGYMLGGLLGEQVGWRAAFWIVGIPGLLLATFVLFLQEPERGAKEGTMGPPRGESYRSLLQNVTYVWNTLAMAALTFVIGGLAAWMPTFLVRVKGLGVAQAATRFGLITAATGILGTLLGGILGDRWRSVNFRAYPLLSAIGLVAAVPFVVLALAADRPMIYMGAIFMAELMIFLNTAPLNAVIASSTSPGMRGGAFGLNIVVIHALGDALSPFLIGLLSDRWGMTAAIAATAPAGLLLSALCCLQTARVMKAS